jgi:hypothetical protein
MQPRARPFHLFAPDLFANRSLSCPESSCQCLVMKRREFEGIADALCQMAVSERLAADLEVLCETPDGLVTIDLVHETANHSGSGPLSLKIVSDLQSWMAKMVADSGAKIMAAQVEISLRTDAVPTDRRRIVMFRLESHSTVTADGHSWRGKPRRRTIWHRRQDQ